MSNNALMIGVSIASYLPAALINPRWAMRHIASYADFAQLLPLRSLQSLRPGDYPLSAPLLEHEWDSEKNIGRTLAAKLRGDVAAGTILDYILFGPTANAQRTFIRMREAPVTSSLSYRLITHNEPTAGQYYEVNPGSFLGPDAIRYRLDELTRQKMAGGLCIDLNHFCRDPTVKEILRCDLNNTELPADAKYLFGKCTLGDWSQSIPVLLEGSTWPVIVHVSPERGAGEYEYICRNPELRPFGCTRLAKKLRLILKYCRPEAFVVEAVPDGLIDRLSWRRQAENLRRFTTLVRHFVAPYYS